MHKTLHPAKLDFAETAAKWYAAIPGQKMGKVLYRPPESA
jgi:hypothetical protein